MCSVVFCFAVCLPVNFGANSGVKAGVKSSLGGFTPDLTPDLSPELHPMIRGQQIRWFTCSAIPHLQNFTRAELAVMRRINKAEKFKIFAYFIPKYYS